MINVGQLNSRLDRSWQVRILQQPSINLDVFQQPADTPWQKYSLGNLGKEIFEMVKISVIKSYKLTL